MASNGVKNIDAVSKSFGAAGPNFKMPSGGPKFKLVDACPPEVRAKLQGNEGPKPAIEKNVTSK